MSGSGSLLAVLAALGFMLPAHAQDGANLRHFAPTPLGDPYVNVVGARTLGAGGLGFGALYSYERRPIVFSDGGERTTDVVPARAAMDLALAYGVLDGWDVAIGLPVLLAMETTVEDRTSGLARIERSPAIGDLAVHTRARLLDIDRGFVGLAIVGHGTAPTGALGRFASESSPVVEIGLAPELAVGSRIDLAANLGYRIRQRSLSDGLTRIVVDDDWTAGAGARWRISPRVAATAETIVSTPSAAPFASTAATPVDGNMAARIRLWRGVSWIVGGGAGLRPGVGSPAWRAFTGLELLPRRRDFDGDGFADHRDDCIDEAGPKNGCARTTSTGSRPTPDSLAPTSSRPLRPPRRSVTQITTAGGDADGDGHIDNDDRCPRLPEDVDGFLDDDGCPDWDNDLDLVPDAVDAAPLHAEDWDGFEDGDGAPDLDNDGDGVPDLFDRCPSQAGPGAGCPVPDTESIAVDIRHSAGDPLVLGDTIHPARPIQFSASGASLQSADESVLDGLARYLVARPHLARVEISVHVNATHDSGKAQRLSTARAGTVVDALVARGVAPKRLVSRGYGETDHNAARRVELRIVARTGDAP